MRCGSVGVVLAWSACAMPSDGAHSSDLADSDGTVEADTDAPLDLVCSPPADPVGAVGRAGRVLALVGDADGLRVVLQQSSVSGGALVVRSWASGAASWSEIDTGLHVGGDSRVAVRLVDGALVAAATLPQGLAAPVSSSVAVVVQTEAGTGAPVLLPVPDDLRSVTDVGLRATASGGVAVVLSGRTATQGTAHAVYVAHDDMRAWPAWVPDDGLVADMVSVGPTVGSVPPWTDGPGWSALLGWDGAAWATRAELAVGAATIASSGDAAPWVLFAADTIAGVAELGGAAVLARVDETTSGEPDAEVMLAVYPGVAEAWLAVDPDGSGSGLVLFGPEAWEESPVRAWGFAVRGGELHAARSVAPGRVVHAGAGVATGPCARTWALVSTSTEGGVPTWALHALGTVAE